MTNSLLRILSDPSVNRISPNMAVIISYSLEINFTNNVGNGKSKSLKKAAINASIIIYSKSMWYHNVANYMNASLTNIIGTNFANTLTVLRYINGYAVRRIYSENPVLRSP